MTDSAAERYLRLGLRLGRHVDGTVDAYFGPPELAAAVNAEPPTDPPTLVAAAEALLDELADGWLRDQVAGLRTYAGVLAGETRSYPDEVEGCYGVRPAHTDETVFTAAHERLEQLLPGAGSLADRHARWEESIRVPADRVERTIAAVIEEARAWTNKTVGLPQGESVELELVHGEPWLAFCEYRGDLRSTISVNVDLALSALELLTIALHETYPGHHTERCRKEQVLVRERGLLEETIVLVPTPQSLVSEGIAGLAPTTLLEGDGGVALAAVLCDEGCEFDLTHALAVRDALDPCRWAEVNAALLLHADGAGEAEVRAYLERYGLMGPELAKHMLRFFSDPTSRTYVLTYAAGRELCAAYVAGDPARFRRLLTEQIRVRDLVARASDIAIDALRPEHWPDVARIYAEGIATGDATFETEVPSWEEWNAAHHAAHRFVALRGGEVLGWAAVGPVSERRVYGGVVENSVYVAERVQGAGVGRLLLERVVASTEAAGIWTIQAGIFPENTPSIRLHERAGFELVGRRRRLARLHGAWRDVLLYERRSGRVE